MPTTLDARNLTVTFGERKALDGVDVTLPIPGLVAIVGGSGAGKSNLIHALLGLAELSAGSLRLGEHNFISTPLSAWRQAIGYVPQETVPSPCFGPR